MALIISLPDVDIDHAAQALREGKILCIPTDTVYGLICSPFIESALHRLADLKNRPRFKPFALFVSDMPRLLRENVTPSERAERLTQRFWPGALTIVMAAEDDCPCAYGGTVGARSPNHPLAQALLTKCGGLLANTSLNRSGEPPARSLHDVGAFLENIDIAIDAGVLPPRPASTVVDCSQSPIKILREGGISAQAVWDCVNL
ncbi:MAG: L-threonylcarbamoyladenylate synthase [Candidatus Omnitrophota bacterium]